MEVLINVIMVIIPQYIHVPSHHFVHLKFTRSVNPVSVKLEKDKQLPMFPPALPPHSVPPLPDLYPCPRLPGWFFLLSIRPHLSYSRASVHAVPATRTPFLHSRPAETLSILRESL